jgi:hypothetical protein
VGSYAHLPLNYGLVFIPAGKKQLSLVARDHAKVGAEFNLLLRHPALRSGAALSFQGIPLNAQKSHMTVQCYLRTEPVLVMLKPSLRYGKYKF